MLESKPPVFPVTRREPELVPPAEQTPRELKPLSDIDDQQGLQFQVPVIHFYPGRHNKDVHGSGRDPVGVIREALAKALVYYYPFAGRLREGPHRKLVVDCTGEGVVFVEAEANVRLQDLAGEGGFLRPPFPCLEELLFEVPGSSGLLHCPLLLFQVTRLRCGGFVFALRLNHTITDAAGLLQFLNAVAEIAKGASQPSVRPVWRREILRSRDPPCITCTHREYEEVQGNIIFPVYDDDNHDCSSNRLVERSFFFGPNEISALRGRLQPHVRGCTSFELLAAFLWRCRTIALRLKPYEQVRFICSVNVRSGYNLALPAYYYGNTSAFPAAVSTVEKISGNGVDYALELIKKAKAEVTEEYIRSVADLMAVRGRPHFTAARSWLVANLKHAGFLEIDFGWGKPEYGGPASAMIGAAPGTMSYFIKGKNGKGEWGVLVPICLPAAAMERFAREVEVLGTARSRY